MLKLPIFDNIESMDLAPLMPSCEFWGYETSFMPYMTAKVAMSSSQGLVMEFRSYERYPVITGDSLDIDNDHIICAAFNLNPKKTSDIIQIVSNAAGNCKLFKNGFYLRDLNVTATHGEEEIGYYWFLSICLPLEDIYEFFGINDLPDEILGNIFKVKKSGSDKHFGAVAPISKGYDLFAPENLVPFKTFSL